MASENKTEKSKGLKVTLNDYNQARTSKDDGALPAPEPARKGIGSIVNDYSAQIQAVLDEKSQRKQSLEKQAQQRQTRMLNVLAEVRRALIDLTRVDLGPVYYLDLLLDDHFGWPRMTVLMKNRKKDESGLPTFLVTAHDKNNSGTVLFDTISDLNKEELHLTTDHDMKLVSPALKRAVRAYLDKVGETALANKETQQDKVQAHTENSKVGDISNVNDFFSEESDSDTFALETTKKDEVEDLYEIPIDPFEDSEDKY